MDGPNALDALIGDTRARLLHLVRGAALTIAELAEALGISENAVRTHVAAAERDGLVRQAGSRRSTGGKPARLYELAPGAEELFPKAHALVFAELVRTLRDAEGDAATLRLLRRVGRRLGAGAGVADGAAEATATGGREGTDASDTSDGSDGSDGSDPCDPSDPSRPGDPTRAARRVRAAAALLDSIGGATEVREEPHGWSIRSAGCPLSGVVVEDPDVCALAEALVAEVTGLSVVEACQKSDRPRCAFRILHDPGRDATGEGSG